MLSPEEFQKVPLLGHKKKAAQFIEEQLTKAGFVPGPGSTPTQEQWATIKPLFGKGVKTRQLKRVYEQKDKLETAVQVMRLGRSGGIYSKRKKKQGLGGQQGKGVRLIERHVSKAPEAKGPGKRSLLMPVFQEVNKTFNTWRKGGQYVDAGDLFVEYLHQADAMKKRLELEMAPDGWLPGRQRALYDEIQKRQAAHDKAEQNIQYTVDFIKDTYGMRLYKPQRLLSISMEEEERRALAGWHSFDQALRLACFDPVENLSDMVADPKAFRDNVEDLVIFMSDQVPMWLKISPGKQLYAAAEVPDIIRRGAQESSVQAPRHQLINDEDDDDPEGLTQLRGENSADQDKYRITVDLEQRVYGWCSDTSDPSFQWGTTSVVFTGAHCRLSNISEDGRWIQTERFHLDGKEVVRLAGNMVPDSFAQSLRSLRQRVRVNLQAQGRSGSSAPPRPFLLCLLFSHLSQFFTTFPTCPTFPYISYFSYLSYFSYFSCFFPLFLPFLLFPTFLPYSMVFLLFLHFLSFLRFLQRCLRFLLFLTFLPYSMVFLLFLLFRSFLSFYNLSYVSHFFLLSLFFLPFLLFLFFLLFHTFPTFPTFSYFSYCFLLFLLFPTFPILSYFSYFSLPFLLFYLIPWVSSFSYFLLLVLVFAPLVLLFLHFSYLSYVFPTFPY